MSRRPKEEGVPCSVYSELVEPLDVYFDEGGVNGLRLGLA